MKTFYCVTFQFQGRTWYAIRKNVPTGLEQPERRCLFKHESVAKALERFLRTESTFKNITVKKVPVPE